MTPKTYDVLVIGGGQAGIPLAYDLAAAGKRVALAERQQLGGSCVNFGCTPTKAAIASAKLAHQARRAQEYGLRIPTVEVDFAAVLDRARALAKGSRDSLTEGLEASSNPVLIKGHATFDGREGERFRVRIGDETVLAEQVVLDTGTRSLIPRIPGLDEVDYLHASNWLDRPELPGHLAIIGGGYIGLEMGQLYRRLGSEVTILEHGAQIAGYEDPDVAQAIQAALEAEGVRIRLHTGVTGIRPSNEGVVLALDGAGSAPLEATHVFVATARKPNTDALGLETIGLPTSDKGIIEVDERLATRVKGVWAVGDIRGGPMFTHTAWDDYRVVLSQLTGGGRRTTERVVPYALFTDPELGRVGMTEQQAKAAGKAFRVGTFEMKGNGKAKELGEPQGFIKVIVEDSSNQILGAAVVAAEGAELVHLYVELMNAKAPYQVLENAIHIHPTLAEAVQSAVSDLPDARARGGRAADQAAPELGIVGLGKIGGNLALQAVEKGIRVVGTSRPPVREDVVAAGVAVAHDVKGLVETLQTPRRIYLSVPAGPAVDELLDELIGLLSPGDVVMDGGNSHFRDSVRRQQWLAEQDIHFVDVGTSGGPAGAREGACFMVGGTQEAVALVAPLLEPLAVPGAFLHAGPPGAGHFVKLVHNAIEFGMLQSIGEGMALLEAGDYDLDLPAVFRNWAHGSVIRGWLVELMVEALERGPALADIDPFVEDTGEVNWILEEAICREVPLPAISQAVWALMQSRDKRHLASRSVSALRHRFGGHPFGPAPAIAEKRRTGKVTWAPCAGASPRSQP